MLTQTINRTTFESDGGHGKHEVITIRRDGQVVGIINHYGDRKWRIKSPHYYEELVKSFITRGEAKIAALTLDYPSKQTVYEIICKRVEASRRWSAEQKHTAELYAAARELVAGSDSATQRISEILNAIDTHAKDRTRPPVDPHSVHYPEPPGRDE
jgi:hypothetical protein